MTINIHGKEYVEVKDRVTAFRKDNSEWSIITAITDYNDNNGTVIIKASIVDDEGRTRATGHAHEWQDDKTSMVNKTSYVENCETSAIGRALACLGYGITEAYASANEVQLAKAKQGQIVSVPKSDEPQGSWANAIIPIGKNKGKTLGDLPPKSRQWYIEEYQANEQYPDSISFRQALDQCKAEMYLGDGDIDPKPPTNERYEEEENTTEIEDEDVPF